MQGDGLHVLCSLGVVDLAACERAPIARIGKRLDERTRSCAPKLTHELGASTPNGNTKIPTMIREIHEGRRRCEFLTLEEHWCTGRQQPHRGDGSIQAGARLLMDPSAEPRRGVRHLIVVIQKYDEPVRREAGGQR